MGKPIAPQLPGRRPAEAADEVTVVHFSGSNVSLDVEALHRVRDRLLAIAGEPTESPLLLDFGNVGSISTLALGTLAHLHKKLLAAGRRLIIHNLSPEIYEAFALTRLDRLFDLRPAEPGSAVAAEDGRAGSSTGVLIVDDEAAVRSVLEAGFGREGFMVWSAAHGQQAVELYRRHLEGIAVVLLDVLMPRMDGPHTLLALQKLCPVVRCCFLTGDPKPYTEEALVQMGAVRVFRKPFAVTEVIDTVRQLANRSSQLRQDRWIEIPRKECGPC